ncbi:MAG: exodeoxyribonuclease VII large subunit [Acidobacteria bacterium]|nr:MAG: exodeoxyribonuclease VII large subunit [Acidobacteriota bacterium]REK02560.1 MAG: exodeoxyribonuclease VII large subunit [Acidobacteriota bacterium]REK13637.1 MAG: exodeoxyribonuclease VII large subunit [Acidobacteriota bacterium]REK41631.1 MAG: exodeoxyribonuclease VII large subunit [Acidobacteriota bacterium]
MNDTLLESLFEEQERGPISVSELNSGIRTTLESAFPSVWVEGEITDFHAAASGHWYFKLTDGDSFIKAACFKGQNYRIRYRPENGHAVRVRGRVTIYQQRGEYQIIVESLEPVGEGALAVAFEQIKAKLQAEGLFDESIKRPLPPFPQRVGVVTSPHGAAVHDILSVLERRARSVSVVIAPTLVQGDGAGDKVALAIELINAYSEAAPESEKIDVLIVSRGGGSTEDLWAFNEEKVARAIRASAIPVISAVGHEVDFTIADFAADLRAPTPSAAAEIVAKSEEMILDNLTNARQKMSRLLDLQMLRARDRLNAAQRSESFYRIPRDITDARNDLREKIRTAFELLEARIDGFSRKTTDLRHRLSPERLSANLEKRRNLLNAASQKNLAAILKVRTRADEKFKVRAASLQALSPLSVLTRGFSLSRDAEGKILRDATKLSLGDRVSVKLLKGAFDADVVAVEVDD